MNAVRPMYIGIIGYIYLSLAFVMLFLTPLVTAWNTHAHTLAEAARSSACIMIFSLSVLSMLAGQNHGRYLVAGILTWAFFRRWFEGHFSPALLIMMLAALLIIFRRQYTSYFSKKIVVGRADFMAITYASLVAVQYLLFVIEPYLFHEGLGNRLKHLATFHTWNLMFFSAFALLCLFILIRDIRSRWEVSGLIKFGLLIQATSIMYVIIPMNWNILYPLHQPAVSAVIQSVYLTSDSENQVIREFATAGMKSRCESVAYDWAKEKFDIADWIQKIGPQQIYFRFKHKPNVDLDTGVIYTADNILKNELLASDGFLVDSRKLLYIYIYYGKYDPETKSHIVGINQNGPNKRSGSNWTLNISHDLVIINETLWSLE